MPAGAVRIHVLSCLLADGKQLSSHHLGEFPQVVLAAELLEADAVLPCDRLQCLAVDHLVVSDLAALCCGLCPWSVAGEIGVVGLFLPLAVAAVAPSLDVLTGITEA